MIENIATAPAPRSDRAPVGAPPDIPVLVQTALSDFLTDRVASMIAADPALEPLAHTARDAVLSGGKRIRPTFAYWGWRGMTGPHAHIETIAPALAALELLHAFALVHDDVMDRSATRRGVRTAHRRLADLHTARSMRGDAIRFGDSAAILVGDLCLVWADQMIADSALPDAILVRARRIYDRMRVDAIAGQYLDVLSECVPVWSIEQGLRTARLKTASYTVTQPLLYGASLAHHPEPLDTALVTAYTRYGDAVGGAFQLRDDLLGLFGEPALTGKPTGDDLTLMKPTVLLQLTRSRATGTQVRYLDRALRRGRPSDVARIAVIATDTGARARVEEMITERIDMAAHALSLAPIDPDTRAALYTLSAAAAWRTT